MFFLPASILLTFKTLLFILAVSLLAAFWKYRTEAIAVGAVGLLLLGANDIRKTVQTEMARNQYQQQLWANRNTSPESVFMLSGQTWRAISQRPLISVTPGGFEPHIYTRSKKSRDYFQSIRNFLTDHGVEDFASLDDSAVRQFAKTYNGNYLIWERAKNFPFDVVYEDSTHRIYKIQ